jgi:two-component system, NarL family, sensor kinase
MSTDLTSTRTETTNRPLLVSRLYRATRGRGELVAFLVTALLALTAVSAGTIWLSERIARDSSLAAAQRSAERLAERLVAPVARDALGGRTERWQDLNRDVAIRIREGSITSVRVWAADGRVVYPTVDPSAPDRLDPPEELPEAIAGEVVADVDHRLPASDGSGSTTVYEVLVPLTVLGRPLAVQTYSSYEGIDEQAARLRAEMAPLAVGALVALQVIQIPIAASLARRVRRQQAERADLLAQVVEASDRERRAIAADVQAGPVQNLAGVTYALRALRASAPPERQASVDRLVGVVRHAVHSLRRLMIDIYPPDLSGPGLAAAISDCADALREQGLQVSIDSGPVTGLGPDGAAVLYRTAKESLANVGKHAQATHVWITLEETELARATAVRLEIADDGVGFPENGTDRRREGHFGLAFLVERVADMGGSVALGTRPGGGAVLTATVPVNRAG